EDPVDGRQAAIGEVAIVPSQALVAVEQKLQVPVKEPVAPQPVKYRLQVKGHILDRQLPVVRYLQVVIHQLFILQENLVDDVGLVAEVVIEVARRNRQVGRNMVGGDVALAPLIEQLKARQQDLVSGFH